MSSNKQDYYRILGLSTRASEEEIKAQYRKLARQHHPDRMTDPDEKAYGEQRLRELNEAYAAILPPKQAAVTDPHNIAIPIATPERLELGEIQLGEVVAVTFRVENAGGGSESISLDYNQHDSWFQVIKIMQINPNKPLPMDFTVAVDTSELIPNKTYLDWIDVYIDDISVRVPISVDVIEAKRAGLLRRLVPILGALLLILLAFFLYQYLGSKPASMVQSQNAQETLTGMAAAPVIALDTPAPTLSVSVAKNKQKPLIQNVILPTVSATTISTTNAPPTTTILTARPTSGSIARSKLYSTTTFSQSELTHVQAVQASTKSKVTDKDLSDDIESETNSETISEIPEPKAIILAEPDTVDIVETFETDAIVLPEPDIIDMPEQGTIVLAKLDTPEPDAADLPDTDTNDASELDAVELSETDTTDTPELDAIALSETDTIDTSELDAIDLPETDTIDTPELDAIELPETDTIDTPELDAVELSETDTIDTPELDAIDLPETDTIDTPELDAIELPETDTIDTPELDAVDLPDTDTTDTTDTPELDAIELSETDTTDTSELDAIELSETDTIDTPELDAVELSDTDTTDTSELDAIALSDTDTTDISELDAVELSETDISASGTISAATSLGAPDASSLIPQTQIASLPNKGVYIRVSDNFRVNARADISTDSEVLMVLEKRTIHPAVGRTFDSAWTLIVLPDNRQAWIFTETVLVDINALNSLPKVLPASFLSGN